MLARVVTLVVLLAAFYQFAAIYWRLWPPITDLIRSVRDVTGVSTLVAGAIVAAAVWAIFHLLIAEAT